MRRKTTAAIRDAVIYWATRHNVATLGDIRDNLRSHSLVTLSKQSISRLLKERKWTRKRGGKAQRKSCDGRVGLISRATLIIWQPMQQTGAEVEWV